MYLLNGFRFDSMLFGQLDELHANMAQPFHFREIGPYAYGLRGTLVLTSVLLLLETV